MIKVFVYGSLRKGKYNNYLLQNANGPYVAKVNGVKKWYQNGLPFPYAKIQEGSETYGEVYEIDKETLTILDKLESHPHHYKRIKMEVEIEGACKEMVWIYLKAK